MRIVVFLWRMLQRYACGLFLYFPVLLEVQLADG